MASQVINGKAFEWAIGIEIVKKYGFKLSNDDTAQRNEACFLDDKVTNAQRENFQSSAKHAVKHILEKEKLVGLTGTVSFLPDSKGKEGEESGSEE